MAKTIRDAILEEGGVCVVLRVDGVDVEAAKGATVDEAVRNMRLNLMFGGMVRDPVAVVDDALSRIREFQGGVEEQLGWLATAREEENEEDEQEILAELEDKFSEYEWSASRCINYIKENDDGRNPVYLPLLDRDEAVADAVNEMMKMTLSEARDIRGKIDENGMRAIAKAAKALGGNADGTVYFDELYEVDENDPVDCARAAVVKLAESRDAIIADDAEEIGVVCYGPEEMKKENDALAGRMAECLVSGDTERMRALNHVRGVYIRTQGIAPVISDRETALAMIACATDDDGRMDESSCWVGSLDEYLYTTARETGESPENIKDELRESVAAGDWGLMTADCDCGGMPSL